MSKIKIISDMKRMRVHMHRYTLKDLLKCILKQEENWEPICEEWLYEKQ